MDWTIVQYLPMEIDLTETGDLARIRDDYARDGVVTVPILADDEAIEHRRALETAEVELGNLHYADKVHTVLRSPFELATDPRALDVVEALIGPDILVYNATYIIKEPATESFVAWHQDLTYWGLLDEDAQVSMWLALSPATDESGCMQMVHGSHREGRLEHVEDRSDSNLLLLGQRLAGSDPTDAVSCALSPGEASFHHGWTVHQSGPNRSDDRRIGLNVQYLAAHNGHHRGHGSAMLVRGEDRHGHFATDPEPAPELHADAVAEWRALAAQMKDWFTDA